MQGKLIAHWAKPNDLPGTDRRCHGAVSEFLTRVNVGKMDFDDRDFDVRQSVTDGDAVVGPSPGIDDDSGCAGTDVLNGVNQGSFMVGLDVTNVQPGR